MRFQAPLLFSNKEQLNTSDVIKRQREALTLGFLQGDLRVDDQTKVPIIEGHEVSETLPPRMVPFHEAMCSTQTDFDAIVHFYEHDFQFMRLFRAPEKYVSQLKKYRYAISPDLSQYIEMPHHRRYAEITQ